MQTERYGASMHVMARDSWTDQRLDDLNARVDRGFEQVDKRFERVEDEFKDVRREMKEGFESLQRSMLQAVIALTVGMLAGFGGLAGLIATQL
jgi:hypothetical protein